jgi:hypothetical protein
MTVRSGAPSSASTRSTSSWLSRSWILQGAVEPLGEVDVPAERVLLCRERPPGRCGSSRARSRPRPGTRAGPRAARSRRTPRPGPPLAARRGTSLGCSATPASTPAYRSAASTANRAPGQVAADLHHPVDADRSGRSQHRPEVVDGHHLTVAADVEVGVVVDHGDGQRVGRHGVPAPARLRRHRVRPPPPGRAPRRRPSRRASRTPARACGSGCRRRPARDSHRGVAE